ncbi:MAG: hypothetical protein N3G22_00070 [Candidatus Micrarchaeota archaeon]|nr:hypothetical protein [Candidatus Micrarchaeota archaeon]
MESKIKGHMFGAEKPPWSLKKKLVVWGTAAALALGSGGAYYFFSHKALMDEIDRKAAEIVRYAPQMGEERARKAAEVLVKRKLPGSKISKEAIAALQGIIDTSEVAKRHGIGIDYVLGVVMKNPRLISLGPKRDAEGNLLISFSPAKDPSKSPSQEAIRGSEALNLFHELPPRLRAEIAGLEYAPSYEEVQKEEPMPKKPPEKKGKAKVQKQKP